MNEAEKIPLYISENSVIA